jgi:hypothetical protein
MKKSILLGVALLACGITFGQHDQKNPQEVAVHQTEQMKKALDLNDSQYASIKKINETYADKFASLRSEKEASDHRGEIQKLRKEKEREINTVLTAEQQKKWKDVKYEKRWNKNQQPGRWFESDKDGLKTALSLTDDQSKKIADENKKFKSAYNKVIHDSSISRKDKKLMLLGLKTLHQSALKETLSQEQFTKFQQLKKEKKKHKHGKHGDQD